MNKLCAIALPAVAVTSMLALAACGGGNSTTRPAATTSSSSTASATASSAPTLTASSALTIVSHAVLGNGDLGNGWSGGLIDDGGTVDSPTLDTCNLDFPSESLRLARNQTEIDSRTVDLSNEVVGYKPGGAKQAIAELVASFATCSAKPQDNGEGTDSYKSHVHATDAARIVGPGFGRRFVHGDRPHRSLELVYRVLDLRRQRRPDLGRLRLGRAGHPGPDLPGRRPGRETARGSHRGPAAFHRIDPGAAWPPAPDGRAQRRDGQRRRRGFGLTRQPRMPSTIE